MRSRPVSLRSTSNVGSMPNHSPAATPSAKAKDTGAPGWVPGREGYSLRSTMCTTTSTARSEGGTLLSAMTMGKEYVSLVSASRGASVVMIQRLPELDTRKVEAPSPSTVTPVTTPPSTSTRDRKATRDTSGTFSFTNSSGVDTRNGAMEPMVTVTDNCELESPSASVAVK